MNKKVLTIAQARAMFKNYSLSVLGASILCASGSACDKTPKNPEETQNPEKPEQKGGSENNQQNLEEIASKKDLKDAIDALAKFDSANYTNNAELAKKLLEYARENEAAKKTDLANFLKFDDKGNVSFKYKVGTVEKEVIIVEKGVLKNSGGSTLMTNTELQTLLDQCTGAADKKPVLNFNENTTFNGKKVDAIVNEVLASLTTKYGYNDGTNDTTGTLKVVIEAVVKAMIGAGATVGTHEANLHANTKVNGTDIVTGNFIDLLVAELNSNKYNNTGGDIAKQSTVGTKLHTLLAAGAMDNAALQALFTAAVGGGGVAEFTLDQATIFNGGSGAPGTFTVAATAIVKALMGDGATAGTLAANLNEGTLFGYNLGGGVKTATFKVGVDELADLRVKALVQDAGYKLHMGTLIAVDNSKEATFTNTRINAADINLVDELVAAKAGLTAEQAKVTELENCIDGAINLTAKIDISPIASSASKHNVMLLHKKLKGITAAADAATAKTQYDAAVAAIGGGNFIGYCEAGDTIDSKDASRDAINAIFNSTPANKVFIYKNTVDNSVGIYKITTNLAPAATNGRCVCLKNDGGWDDTLIQIGG